MMGDPLAQSKQRSAIFVACLGLLLNLGCQEPAASEREEAALPNVVLISVDTLRQDHLSCYGYSRETSPNIDALARSGTLFTNAVVPRPLTAPSVASLLTGVYPFRHGVCNNYIQLHDSMTTIAELLGEAGYYSAAFISNYVLLKELSSFDQGFDLYDDTLPDKEKNRKFYERVGGDTLVQAARWLREARPSQQPLFLWVHFMDPHGPYTPPGDYQSRFQDGEEDLLPKAKIPKYQFLGSRDRQFYVNLYDAEIAYCDEMIGHLLGVLRSEGLFDSSLILLHADHGESLGEHGVYFKHGQDLFEPGVKIPLILKAPAGHQGFGARSDQLACVTDLLPTILDFCGVTIPGGLDGESLLQVEQQGGRQAPVLLERLGERAASGGGQMLALRRNNDKLLYALEDNGTTVQSRAFYQLQQSPDEQQDSYDPSKPEVADAMQQLDDWIEKIGSFERGFEPLQFSPEDPEKFIRQLEKTHRNRDANADLEALRALGYVDE